MAELKTKKTEQSVSQFIDAIDDPRKREDSRKIIDLMRQVTQAEPKMWGEAIIGFGDYHYRYESGREGDWFLMGFSPRKQNLTLYMTIYMDQCGDRFQALLEQLGKHKTAKSCLYLNKLDDVNIDILKQLLELSYEHALQR